MPQAGNRITTDICKIREIVKQFIFIEPQKMDFPLTVSHPFTSSSVVLMGHTLADLSNVDSLEEWQSFLVERIDSSTLTEIFFMVNGPYILTILKYVQQHISNDDLALILREFWTLIEAPNCDTNVKAPTILKWFKRATPDLLMNKDELKAVQKLPYDVTIYRGVTSHNNRKKKALSWTLNIEKARWFAERYNTGTGELWKASIPKSKILCLFDGRDESEVIVDLYGKNVPIEISTLKTNI